MKDSDYSIESASDDSEPLENWRDFNVLPSADGIDAIRSGDVKALLSAQDMIYDHSPN
jgi:hypothetical protein